MLGMQRKMEICLEKREKKELGIEYIVVYIKKKEGVIFFFGGVKKRQKNGGFIRNSFVDEDTFVKRRDIFLLFSEGFKLLFWEEAFVFVS